MRHLSRLLVLSLLTTMIILVAPAEKGYANPPQLAADWSSTMTDVIPKTLQASVGGVVTGTSACSTTTAVIGVSEATGSRTTEVSSSDPLNGTRCVWESEVDRHGIVYNIETTMSTFTRTIRAYDGYTLLWSKPLGTCATNWGTNPIAAASIRVGADGGIYYIELDASMQCSNPQPNRLVKLDAKTGNTRFSVDLSGNIANFATTSDRMFTWDGGMAVADGNKLRYFNFIGEELLGMSKTFPWQINQFAVDNAGMAVAVDETGQWVNPYCPNIIHYDGDATHSLSTYSTGECLRSINKIYGTGNGSYAIEFFDGPSYGQGNLIVKTFDSSGNTVYEKNITPNSESGAVNNTVINFDEYRRLWVTQRENDSSLTVERFDSLGVSEDSFTAQGISAPANGVGPVTMRAGSIFIPICVVDCSGYTGVSSGSVLYKFTMGNAGDDYPKGYIVNKGKPGTAYVAMGDSYSSGEGNPDFIASTDQASSNECHRSKELAYPSLLSDDAGVGVDLVDFVACSGATTANVLYGGSSKGSWGEAPQTDALSVDTNTVTLTIGGNDIGFEDYARICVVAACGPGAGQMAYDAIMDNINSPAFADNLKTTYRAVLTEAEVAEVYVIDYPYLFDPTGNDSTGCVVMDASGGTLVVNALNSTIALAIAEVRSESTDFSNRLNYVSSNASGSPFEGKHLCTDDPAGSSFHNVYVPPFNSEYSLHPNNNGHENYFDLMEALL